MVFAEVNRVYLRLVERWKGSLTILRALSKTSKQDEGFVTDVTADVTRGVTFPVWFQVSDCPPARPWEHTKPCNEATSTKGTWKSLSPRLGVTSHLSPFGGPFRRYPPGELTPDAQNSDI